METFKEGEWVILLQLNKKKLARIGRKGFTTLGKDFVSLEGAIGCLPWTNFKMEPSSGPKSGKRIFNIVPLGEDEEYDYGDLNPDDHTDVAIDEEERDNRTINDDGQSQGLSAVEIEALREGGLTGKEIVNHLVANSSTYDKKTRYSKSKYLKKKESKHCLREKISMRRTTLSSVAEVLCSGGGGEGSRGSISGMRPDTLSQMLTALNIQWQRLPSVKQTLPKKGSHRVKNGVESAVSERKDTNKVLVDEANDEKSLVKKEYVLKDIKEEEILEKGAVENIASKEVNPSLNSGTTYIVYESGNWGLLVASLLTLLPADGPRLIHLYPGHGVPCLIAPRALNLPQEKLSILSSVNFKALLEELGKLRESPAIPPMDEIVVKTELEHQVLDCEGSNELVDNRDLDTMEEGSGDALLEENSMNDPDNETFDNVDESSKGDGENRKRKIDPGEGSEENELAAKKPRWQQEAEIAAGILTSRQADGLVVVASREHPVTIVLSLLPYLAPSRPLVVYCPHREPLLELYAVLKGWEPWASKYGKCGGKGGIPRVANLRVVENWLRSYQVLPNRTHPEVNMTPGGGFVLTGTVIDFIDE
ncbi:uncharacterized protein LOC124169111 [Ischnura elegans]|uniref:uncharacterized protein LOC124169111 n=1 Tax=Ischnura elegans TaxID=197161 RepID=UPI001ED8712B|nr:uncharacterized protein LOC124169111 [Ischnura elegans]XP_046403561.1 uncharacterized protein LOC124169111 [Ischnura elegans]